MYTNPCCGMIAMKREVAAKSKSLMAGFPWSECQVRKLTTSHCTDNQIYRGVESTCESRRSLPRCYEPEERKHRRFGHTRKSVQSPLVVLKELKVRKGGDFFYGKSGNENYIKGL